MNELPQRVMLTMMLPSELLLMWPVLLESMLMMTVVNLLLTTHCE